MTQTEETKLNEFQLAQLGRQAQIRQAAADEQLAAEKANDLGLTGAEAERFKSRLVTEVQAARATVRQHMKAVVESPEGQARPAAALQIAMEPGLTTQQAIAKLAGMPNEAEAEDAANFILRAGR